MLTSKQRSYLRKLANPIDAIFQIGKGGINEELIKQVNQALEARELVKVHVLNNSSLTVKEAFHSLAEATGSEEVQVVGNKFVLYKRAKEKPEIVLP